MAEQFFKNKLGSNYKKKHFVRKKLYIFTNVVRQNFLLCSCYHPNLTNTHIHTHKPSFPSNRKGDMKICGPSDCSKNPPPSRAYF